MLSEVLISYAGLGVGFLLQKLAPGEVDMAPWAFVWLKYLVLVGIAAVLFGYGFTFVGLAFILALGLLSFLKRLHAPFVYPLLALILVSVGGSSALVGIGFLIFVYGFFASLDDHLWWTVLYPILGVGLSF